MWFNKTQVCLWKGTTKSQDYETIIVSSICRHSHRVRGTTGGSSGSGRNWWLHLRPIRENCRGMGAWKPGLQEWTTAQLQQRRLDLYATVPMTRNRNEVPAYIYSGMPLPQQDEIKAIEVELNKRYQAGDKTAELKEFWPSARRHIASGPRVESLF